MSVQRSNASITSEPWGLPPEPNGADQEVGSPLTLHSQGDDVVSSVGSDTADDRLGLGVSKNSVLAVPASNSALLHATHGNIERVVDQQGRVDYG